MKFILTRCSEYGGNLNDFGDDEPRIIHEKAKAENFNDNIKLWTIEINTLEELIDFVKENKRIIIDRKMDHSDCKIDKEYQHIIIFDGYYQ